MVVENLNEKIKAYALKNAISYKGRANPGAVVSALFNEGLEKSDVKDVMPKIQYTIKEISSLSVDEMQLEFDRLEKFTSKREEREGLRELPNSDDGVNMRIAPSPSGPLHMMHVINLALNYLYVKKYGGELYVRIEDTNSDNIYPGAYEMIPEEASWLTNKDSCVKVIVQSERMELYYNYAKKMLNSNDAYICTCSAEDFRDFSKNKKECPCRNLLVKENLERFDRMFDKKNGFQEGQAVMRFKTLNELGGMSNPNPAMRDFPLMRINDSVHPKQGTRYRVWPLMNLSVTVDDIETKMSHIIRGKDHKDNAERQKMMYKVLGKEGSYPWVAFTGMTNFVGMKFSTREMRQGIEDGKYSGWDDSQLSTAASLRKRGYSPEAFLKYAELTCNISEVDKTVRKEDFFQLLDKLNLE